jgi:DNA processing protein
MDPNAAYLASGGRVLEKGALGHLGRRFSKQMQMFARGGLVLGGAPVVAVVGTREPTPEGEVRAKAVAASLASAGAVVVSGGAKGIDRAAHEAAIAAGGSTIAVLGTVAAPSDERPGWMKPLFDRDRGRALSLTPYPPDTPHADWHYAARNKLIAGLADAVVIVEGRAQSGTRYTADAAIKFAVPIWCCLGATAESAIGFEFVNAGKARGLPPWLDPAEVILGVPAQPNAAPATPPRPPPPPEDPLLAALAARGGRLHVDEARVRLDMPLGRLLARASALEADGWLRRDGAFLVTT